VSPMRTFHLILYIVAALAFAVAFLTPGIRTRGTANPTNPGGDPLLEIRRWNLVALGLLAWVIVPLSNIIEDISD
jgi:hypothetical protein